MNEQQKKKAPIGVKALSGLSILAGALMVIGGMTMMALVSSTPALFTGLVPPEHLTKVPVLFALFGSTSVTLGIAFGAIAVGLYRGTELAWKVLTILAFIGIGISVIILATGDIAGIVGILISGAVVLYLRRPSVKEYFKQNVMVAQAS
jgi:MFS family permease